MSVLPSALFAQVRRSGIAFGFTGPQLGILLACLAVLLGAQITGGPVALAKSLPIIGPVALVGGGSWRGRTFLSRIGGEMLFGFRKATGQTVATVDVTAPRVEGKLEIPGAVGERMHVLDLVGTRYPGGAMVWDAATGEATAVVLVTTQAWNLASLTMQGARATAFSNACRAVAAMAGVTRVKTHARTIPRGSDHLRLDNGDEVLSWFASREYDEALAEGPLSTALYRDVLVTITVSRAKVAAEVKEGGGGQKGMSAVMDDRVTNLMAKLVAAGVRVVGARWLGTGEIRNATRIACDPAAAWWLNPAGSLPDAAVVCSSIREHRTYVELDSGSARTWWVEVMPTERVEAGFLDNLVSAGGFSHTVTEIFVPADLRSSEKRLRNAEQSHNSVAQRDEKLGREPSAAHDAEGKELVQRRKDLTAGYGDVRWSIYVTGTAPARADLDSIGRWLEDACPGVGLNGLPGQQLTAFALSGLALGIGPRS